MKVTLAMAISPNGLVARENGEEDWLPSEGWDEFLILAQQFNNFIMGRETYELVSELYEDYNFDNVPSANKIIVTRNKEFLAKEPYVVAHSPEEAIEKVSEQGMNNALLIGGGKLNSAFLKRNLVDEIWLTINPHILGKGRPFVFSEDLDIPLTLISSEELSAGRVLLKYQCKQK